jgi:clan AA aspartic protease
MITGVVTEYGTAVVTVSLLALNRNSSTVEAVIDTGFNGFLTLPVPEIARLQFPYEGTMRVELGNGQEVELDVFSGSVLWDGQVRTGLVLAADGTPLIGMALLEGSRVCLDVIANGSVSIERLP